MKISYNWLQTHFTEKLPQPLELADLITMRSSEVDGVENVTDAVGKIIDTVIDIKILPDRAHYALSHRGIAYEVAAITGLKRADISLAIPAQKTDGHTTKVLVKNLVPQLCRRYTTCLIEGITVGESSAQMKAALEAIGARSINNIVDATNLIMFDIGQPMHAFDADKVQGGITIRMAQNGEKMTLLDGREVELDQTVLVIADDMGPLAIAGVKGGKRAEVTVTTTRIILESANFDPTTVRRTSTRLNLRNDSSKRFENEITPHLTSEGLNAFLYHIPFLCPAAKIGPVTDVYESLPEQRMITLQKAQVERVLGLTMSDADFELQLARLNVSFVKGGANAGAAGTVGTYTLTIPHERLDIVIAADIAEEVGRLYGYDKVPSTVLSTTDFVPKVEPTYYVSEKIKNVLQDVGFSEIITQTLGKKGDLEVAYPVARDRGFLRKTLRTRIEESLDLNIHAAALLGVAAINVFEIGKVFNGEAESLQLAIGSRSTIKPKKGSQSPLERALVAVNEALQVDPTAIGAVMEQTAEVVVIDLGKVVSVLETESKIPATYGDAIRLENKVVKYAKISPYPYIVRDIAVFVPATVAQAELEKIIDAHTGALMVRRDLFDVFTKKSETGEDKTSYAFRMVFQSMERTLTDDEINPIMEKLTAAMNAQAGWVVR